MEQAGENNQLKNLGDWLEPAKGIYNPYSVITNEKIKFKNGKFIDTLTSYKNDLKYSEIIFSSDKNNLGRLKQINCFDNSGDIVRSRFFEYSSITNNSYSNTYEYHFRDGKNVDLANLDKSILTIENLLERFRGDEAVKIINECRNNFPSNLQQNVKLNELNQKAKQVQNSKQQIDSAMTKSNKLIDEKKYSEALDVLNSTKILINKDFNTEFEQYNIVLNRISEVQNLISLQEKEKLEVNSKIENGKKYLAANNYDLALKTFQDARNNNLSVDYSINTVLDNLIKTTKENQIKEIERRELLKLDNAINEGSRLVSIKKYNEAIQLYENARKNNFKTDLKQNKTLDLKISETKDLIKEDIKRKLYENFDRDLDFTKIGKVEISREYLKVNQFTNGDKLDFASTAEEFVEKTLSQIPTYCFYNFDSKFESKGYYYNIFALNDLNGRQLFPDDYRLPFNSELSYMNTIVNVQESKKEFNKRQDLKSYLFKSNSELIYNGYNFVSYSRKIFNGRIYDEKINKSGDGYGKFGYIDELDQLSHMFWILADFSCDDEEIKPDYNLLNINFKRKNYSLYRDEEIKNPIEYGICNLQRKTDSYSKNRFFVSSGDQNIERILPRPLHDRDNIDLVASQIKLVKQRPAILPTDWNELATSTILKFKHEEGYGQNKISTSNIKVARNQDEWLGYCNNKIPACISYKENSLNDPNYGKLYNIYTFSYKWGEGLNYPIQPNTKLMDLIDISNLRYSFNGSGEEFYQYLYNNQSLKFGGSCDYDNVNKKLIWNDNLNSSNKSPYGSDFGFILMAYDTRNFPAKDFQYLTLKKSVYYNDNNFHFVFRFNEMNSNSNNIDYNGYSIRFLKN